MAARRPRKVVLGLEQIAALRSKLRARIVDLIYNAGELTVAQIAEELGQKPTALYRHLDHLVEVGLLIEGEPVRTEKNFARVFVGPGDTLAYVPPGEADEEMREAVAGLIAYELNLAARETARAYAERIGTVGVPSAHLKYVSTTGWLSREERARVNALLDEVVAVFSASSHGPGKDLQTISFASRPST